MKCHRIRLLSDGSEHWAEKHYPVTTGYEITQRVYPVSEVHMQHMLDQRAKRCRETESYKTCKNFENEGYGCPLKGNFEGCISTLGLHTKECQRILRKRYSSITCHSQKTIQVRVAWAGEMFLYREDKDCWQIVKPFQYEMVQGQVLIRNVPD